MCASGDRDRGVAWEAVANFKRELDMRKTGEIDVRSNSGNTGGTGFSGGWAVIDGRGMNCAGVIAALSKQIQSDSSCLIEAVLHDALNIYDVILWAEQAGHRLLTQRRETDGTMRVLIQPKVPFGVATS